MEDIEIRWRKSTYSGGNGGECVEVGTRPSQAGPVLVRDTKDTALPVLEFGPAQWRRFLAEVKSQH
jgi:Domain of unknown function (DUF397)